MAADDVLKVMIAAEHLEHGNIDDEVVKMLGLSSEHTDSLKTHAKDLATLLKLRTVQSIVKKVNRTVARHNAFKLLCRDSSEDVRKVTLIDCSDGDIDEAATDIMKMHPPSLSCQLRDLFSSSSFGFVPHLLAMESEQSTSPGKTAGSSSRVFCLDPCQQIVDQVRDLNILEHLISRGNQVWTCLTFQQFYQTYKSLLSSLHQNISDDALMNEVMRMIDDDDLIEINDDTGQVIMRNESQQRLEQKLQMKREGSALVIQKWWRRMKLSMMTVKEQDLIETVLRKYETLQRQSKELVYSFTDKNNNAEAEDTIDEVEALQANIDEVGDPEEEQTSNIVLQTSEFYGLDLVRSYFKI